MPWSRNQASTFDPCDVWPQPRRVASLEREIEGSQLIQPIGERREADNDKCDSRNP